MIRGLVIGKFLPIHNGHVALIRFAEKQCDELIVSMSHSDSDPIDPTLRFQWIKEIFEDTPSIKPALIKDDFDDESLGWSERTKIWADVIQQHYPPIDILFSSERYGGPFAQNLNARHVSFDLERKQFPVSGALVRQHPFRYWNFIPDVVRPCFVKKICFYGPESTGKSVLAEKMARHYQTEFVPEVARELITSNDFTAEDIVRIGHAHYDRIQQKLKSANKILFCDTDAITTQIYSHKYLGVVPPVLFELEQKVHYDLYFLFDIDVPWVADGLRDLGDQRQEMFELFKDALRRRGIFFYHLTGDFTSRERFIIEKIDAILTL